MLTGHRHASRHDSKSGGADLGKTAGQTSLTVPKWLVRARVLTEPCGDELHPPPTAK